jgi:hypothetical protein
MSLPLSFAGTLTIVEGASEGYAQKLKTAIASEGGSNIQSSDHRITFRGLTGYRSFSPLANVENGVIEIREQAAGVDVVYAITVERRPFIFSILVTLAGLWLMALGFTQFGFFAASGLGFLVLSIANSFIIRFRLRNWLRRISVRPA